MKTLCFFLVILFIFVSGCASDKPVDEAIVEVEAVEELTEEEPTPETEPFFIFMGMGQEEVMAYFEEQPTSLELIYPNLFFEEQNVIFIFSEAGEVFNVGIFEGNEILGIDILGEYDRDYIIGILGDPDEEEIVSEEKERIIYFVDEFKVSFMKNWVMHPFSAGVVFK